MYCEFEVMLGIQGLCRFPQSARSAPIHHAGQHRDNQREGKSHDPLVRAQKSCMETVCGTIPEKSSGT